MAEPKVSVRRLIWLTAILFIRALTSICECDECARSQVYKNIASSPHYTTAESIFYNVYIYLFATAITKYKVKLP